MNTTMFCGKDDFLNMANQFLANGDHWVFVYGQQSDELVGEIERKYYLGAAGQQDFNPIILPLPGLPIVVFAHKRRMTAKQLRRILASYSAYHTAEQLMKQGIILLRGEHGDTGAIEAATLLLSIQAKGGSWRGKNNDAG